MCQNLKNLYLSSMDTTSFNTGCALIATAPLIVGHLVFHDNIRYILFSWFCAFVATILLIACSLSPLITTNYYLILFISCPIDTLGKLILTIVAKRLKFLQTPVTRISVGLCCGLGYGLAHVLTMYLPIVMDQPYSIDFTKNHPAWFPSSLELAFVYHALSIFHMASSLFFIRFWDKNVFILYLVGTASHLIISYITLIPYFWVKVPIITILSYFLLYYISGLYTSIQYEPIDNIPEDELENPDQNKLQIQTDTTD